jgi:hypothetical protein
MAAMIYCFVIPYCFSWGPVPWVYWYVLHLPLLSPLCALADPPFASPAVPRSSPCESERWAWLSLPRLSGASTLSSPVRANLPLVSLSPVSDVPCPVFATEITLYLINGLPNGKVFFLFACTNLLSAAFAFWLKETAGVSLEDMDVRACPFPLPSSALHEVLETDILRAFLSSCSVRCRHSRGARQLHRRPGCKARGRPRPSLGQGKGL